MIDQRTQLPLRSYIVASPLKPNLRVNVVGMQTDLRNREAISEEIAQMFGYVAEYIAQVVFDRSADMELMIR